MKFKKFLVIVFVIILLVVSITPKIAYAEDFSTRSEAVVLYNINTNKIVYCKNESERMFPASITKIMTALLVLENCELDETEVVTKEDLDFSDEYVKSGIKVDETYTINDLLYLLMLSSANDAANILARHVSGGISEFSNLMNSRALELGCENTNFVNPNGIHDENHYTTAYDMLLIAINVMQNEEFRNLVSTPVYTIKNIDGTNEKTIYNSNKLIQQKNIEDGSQNKYYYPYATGIKTGFTSQAGRCLIASATRNNNDYIAVILGAPEYETNKSSVRFEDAIDLFQTAFRNYDAYAIRKKGEIIKKVNVTGAEDGNNELNLILEDDLILYFRNEDVYSELKYDVNLDNSKLVAPIHEGDVVGKLVYTYNGELYTQNIVADRDVKEGNKVNLIYTLILIGFLILLITTVYEIIIKKRA